MSRGKLIIPAPLPNASVPGRLSGAAGWQFRSWCCTTTCAAQSARSLFKLSGTCARQRSRRQQHTTIGPWSTYLSHRFSNRLMTHRSTDRTSRSVCRTPFERLRGLRQTESHQRTETRHRFDPAQPYGHKLPQNNKHHRRKKALNSQCVSTNSQQPERTPTSTIRRATLAVQDKERRKRRKRLVQSVVQREAQDVEVSASRVACALSLDVFPWLWERRRWKAQCAASW